MKNLKVFINGLRKRFFPSEEDKAWKQWVDFKNRDKNDLIGLLTSGVGDSFKRRALYLLFIPSSDFKIIYWERPIENFHYGTDFLKSLTVDLLDYVVELIIGFYSALKPMNGVVVSIPDKYRDALNYYNTCILCLLALLPEEKAEKIFPYFSLKDITSFWNMDCASGYNPFGKLLLAKGISERWKREADVKMRKIVLGEISGKTKSREEWEEAIHNYADFVMTLISRKAIKHYPLELFISQVQFIMDNRKDQKKLIKDWQLFMLFKLLAGDKHEELRHTIARYALLEDNSEFSRFCIYDLTRPAVEYILREFGDDLELVAKIKILEEEKDKKQTELAVYQAERAAAEEDILNQMR